ncbi:NUDIX hydrolase [Ochrobactrum quorumnocens]|uniref:NUDIX hydrolase n=1 Tax=Ochrobactrum quorumnocens TaxID=271865 RepID=UPI003853AC85
MEKKVVTVGAFVVNDEGKVLMGLRSPWKKAWPEHWDTPGGHVEPGETLEEALIREMGEEIGIRPTQFRWIGAVDEKRPDLYGDSICQIYQVTAWDGGEPRNVCDEHSQIKWFSPEELANLLNLADAEYQHLARVATNTASNYSGSS